ncbi:MAG: hypothetical protein IT244_12455 [Bacteroidia bacterium]|nr:hypothetical protein [Bacteroidia bacterium]
MTMDLRSKENLHILFWLLKDFAWIAGFKILGCCMIVPTVTLAFWLTWKGWSTIDDRLHNLAVTCWIVANSIWMFGEFFLKDQTRPFAIPFFIVGLALMFWYYVPKLFQRIK